MAAKPKRRRAANATAVKPRRRRKARNPSRVVRSRANFFQKAQPVRRRRRSAARRKNPLVIIRNRKSNPSGSVILEFILAGTGIGFVQPWVSGFISKIGLPGQFITPVSTAAAGLGLSWFFGLFKMTKRLAEPALILGVSTGVVALIAPYVRRWLQPSMPMQQPANGVSGRYANGPRGIGVWSGQPTNPPVRLAAAPASTKPAASGVKGVGIWTQPAGRFARR